MKLNSLLNAILVIEFLSLCSCYKCPTSDDIVEVDLSQMNGEWYMVAGTPITGKLGSCMHFQMNSNNKNFRMNFTTTSYRNNQRLLWKVSGGQSGSQLSATWQLSFSPRVLGPFQHQILSIDYDNYCSMVVCSNDTLVIKKQMFGMIWSRDKSLPTDTLSRLKRQLSTYVDENDILDVDNTCENITF